jgi:replicative DNA helicase
MSSGNGKSVELRADQLAPHATEAEEAVLGSVLVNPVSYAEVSTLINPDDFFIVRNAWIWSSFEALSTRGIEPDIVTVATELEAQGHIAEVGGYSYLAQLTAHTPSSLNIVGYAKMVAEFAYRRRLIDFASTTARMAHSDETSLLEIHDRISRSLTDLGGKTIRTHRSAREAFTDFAGDFAVRLQDARDGQPHVGLDLGLPEWNTLMDGDFRPGGYIGIMGLTKIGKTWAMMQMAEAAAHQVPVLYFSLENLEESLLNRFAAIHSGVPLTCIRTGLYKGSPMPDDMASKVYQASDALARLPIEFVCHLNSAREIEYHIKAATIRHGQVGMAFIDTLNQLADAATSSSDRYENLAKASGRVLQTMRATGWGMVAAIQMRMELKAGMKTKVAKQAAFPAIQSVEGCRKIVQDVSKLIGIYRADYVAEKINSPGYYDEQCPPGMASFIDVAARDSEGNTDCLVRWNKRVPRFETATYEPDIQPEQATTHAQMSIPSEDLLDLEAAGK